MTVPIADHSAAPLWPLDGAALNRSVLAAVALLLLIAAQWSVAAEMASIWMRSVTFNHCPLVPVISVWLIWDMRDELRGVAAGGSLLGVLAVAAMQGLLVFGSVLDLQVVQHAALVGTVPALVLAFWGTGVALRLVFPLGFLVFAIPFGHEFVPALMQVTADFTVGALQVLGIPVFREGMYFELPSGLFEVAEACSGIRYLLASLTVGTLYSWVFLRDWRFRAGFIVLSAVVPILANGLRALGIVLIAHYSEMALATGVDHLVYGWLFFGLVMVLLVLLARWLAGWEPAKPARLFTAPDTVATGPGAPVVLVLVGLLVIAAGLARHGLDRVTEATVPGALPQMVADWPAVGSRPAQAGVPGYGGYDRVLQQNFRSSAGERIDLTVLLYLAQYQGHELVNLEHRMVQEARGRVIGEGVRGVPPGLLEQANWLQFRGANGRTNDLAWWYLVDGRVHTSAFTAKAHETLLRLVGRPFASALVEVSSNGIEAQRLAAFVTQAQPLVAACLYGPAGSSASCGSGQ